MNYSVQGSGKPVLFLHGWGGNQLNFKGVIDYLLFRGEQHKCINLDFPPFGHSTKSDNSLTIYDYADMVYDLIKALNIDNLSIVGHSFGGRVALIIASQYPEILNKLILVNSAGIKPRFNLIKKLKIAVYKTAKFLNLKHILKINLTKFGSSNYKDLDNVMKQTFINIINADLTDLIPLIKADTLIFWGKKDRETPIYMAKKLHKLIFGSKLVICNGGHYSYLDCFNIFLNNIIIFLNRGNS
ncbi:MAG: alpha/beta hydrolase [Clostridia bacterium]